MSDLAMILTGAISLVTIILVALVAWKGSMSGEKPARPVPVMRDEAGPAGVRRPRRSVRSRMREGRLPDEDEGGEDEPMPEDPFAMPEGKIGAKKRKKLEMKAEKRAQRERDIEEREERKQKLAAEEERKKRELEMEKQVEEQKEAEEKRLREEREQQELEEYLKLKEAFSVEEEGYDAATEEESRNKLQEFVDRIKTDKVVILEDLAASFQLKTQDCIDRIQALLANETLVGVVDDRGKFIYVTRQELEEVARFIRQRGRVSIGELVESSNSLVNLTPAMASA